jgi:hypothetical protein
MTYRRDAHQPVAMSDIVWESPPPEEPRPTSIRAFQEALQQRPGQWARYPRLFASNTAGTYRRYLGPRFDVVSRKIEIEPDKYALFVRYLPENTPEAS